MVSEPPLVLAFDTAAAHCAAVLVRGGQVLSLRNEAMGRGQAERLLPMIEEMLAEARIDWLGLDGVAVCTGPGNFTGLRVAVAAARGLAMALGAAVVGVSRFEVLGDRKGTTVVAVNGKRDTFWQAFQDGAALGPPVADALPDMPPDAVVIDGTTTQVDLVALARIAAHRLGRAPAPAPLYLAPADAMPPAEAPPRLLDDA